MLEAIQDVYSLELFRRKVQQVQSHEKAALVSITQRIWASDPFELFGRGQSITAERIFWSQPNQAIRVGFGCAYRLNTTGADRFIQTSQAWESLLTNAIIQDADNQGGPILFGGFAFDPQQQTTSLWQGYPDGQMILPQVMFSFADDAAWLTTNIVINPGDDLQAQIQHIGQMIYQLLEANSPYSYSDDQANIQVNELQPAESWQAEVSHIIEAIRRGDLEKAVLARAIQLDSTRPFEVSRSLQYLSSHYPGCYIFAFAQDSRCFLGATPERLIQLRGNQVKTMCLAGSTKRGATPNEDQQLGEELLASEKNRNEHRVVLKTLIEALNETCTGLQFSDTPDLLKLGNVQHLCTLITGKLAAGHTLMELVQSLHPTPAVGGRPRETALALIRELEGLDRGWYAGAIGWLDQHGDGEFAVAIRSALIHDQQATLFAGCGIMADSDPEREYAESCLKFRPMLAALGAEV